MQKTKSILKSRTFLLAAAQAVGGLVLLFLTEADMVGLAVMIKSIMDIALRLDTDTAVKL